MALAVCDRLDCACCGVGVVSGDAHFCTGRVPETMGGKAMPPNDTGPARGKLSTKDSRMLAVARRAHSSCSKRWWPLLGALRPTRTEKERLALWRSTPDPRSPANRLGQRALGSATYLPNWGCTDLFLPSRAETPTDCGGCGTVESGMRPI